MMSIHDRVTFISLVNYCSQPIIARDGFFSSNVRNRPGLRCHSSHHSRLHPPLLTGPSGPPGDAITVRGRFPYDVLYLREEEEEEVAARSEDAREI